MFKKNSKITTIGTIDLSNQNDDFMASDTFNRCSALKSIDRLIVGKKATFFGSFDYCSALEYIGFEGELWTDICIDNSPDLNEETLRRLAYIAKDFVNDEDEEVQELAYTYSIMLSGDTYGFLWDHTADERFPEEYQGMLLGEILDAKGWGT